jgi:hypothetical protein
MMLAAHAEPPSFGRKYRETWANARPIILERVGILRHAALALDAGRLDEAMRADAERAAHKIADTASAFGFWDASQLAREARAALDTRTPSSPGVTARFMEITERLRCLLSE